MVKLGWVAMWCLRRAGSFLEYLGSRHACVTTDDSDAQTIPVTVTGHGWLNPEEMAIWQKGNLGPVPQSPTERLKSDCKTTVTWDEEDAGGMGVGVLYVGTFHIDGVDNMRHSNWCQSNIIHVEIWLSVFSQRCNGGVDRFGRYPPPPFVGPYKINQCPNCHQASKRDGPELNFQN